MNVTPEEHAELRMLLLEVCDAESGLTAWEVEFIDSQLLQPDTSCRLSKC